MCACTFYVYVFLSIRLYDWCSLHVLALIMMINQSIVQFTNLFYRLRTQTQEWSDQEKKLVEDLVPLYCNSQTQYNELASLYLTDSDTAIKQLFHFREIGYL